MNPAIFKAYDIRGVYPTDLDEVVAEDVAHAFSQLVKPVQCVVGHDMRVGSSTLAKAVVTGFCQAGVNVLDIGQCSTDQFYFACVDRKSSGIMITASHNPKQYNGIKMIREIPYSIGKGTGMEEIQDLVINKTRSVSKNTGTVSSVDVAPAFTQWMVGQFRGQTIAPLKIVVDAGNGMGGVAAGPVYAQLPFTVVPMYWEPDGTFPHHGPDPLQMENRRELQARVLSEQADCGFSFDGDGDRFFVIDNGGAFVSGDFLTALLAEEFLRQYPGSPIVYDVRASWAVRDVVARAGGTALMNRVGHGFIKRRMIEEHAVFGGEVTGHYYFKDFFFVDSSVLPSLHVIALLSRTGEKLTELLQPLRDRYFISGEINYTVSDVLGAIVRLRNHFADAPKVYELDGISIEYPEWHFNVRPSNTEPLLRLNLESIVSREHMEEKLVEVASIITA